MWGESVYVSFHVFFGTVKVDRILCDFGFGCHHELMYSVCVYVCVCVCVCVSVNVNVSVCVRQ